MQWGWPALDPGYGSYGNPNQWTVNAGIASLARESTQNSADARLKDAPAKLIFSLIRLNGTERKSFEDALN